AAGAREPSRRGATGVAARWPYTKPIGAGPPCCNRWNGRRRSPLHTVPAMRALTVRALMTMQRMARGFANLSREHLRGAATEGVVTAQALVALGVPESR